MRRAIAVALFAAACGVRAPAPVDMATLSRDPTEAHRQLQSQVLSHPRDIAARLALAKLADAQGRPSEAIEQLETVEHLGGPLGTRWHDEDRARFARLLLARGRARLTRGASTALADFEHAAKLGASTSPDEIERARLAIAFEQLRHIDPDLRTRGRATLAATRRPEWRGAEPTASFEERARFGVWLWSMGARREAFEQLAAWHDATKSPRDPALQGAYLRALAWWSPTWLGEVPPPPAEDLVGPERCWFPGADCLPPTAENVPSSTGAAPPTAENAASLPVETMPQSPENVAPSTNDSSMSADARAVIAARYAATRASAAAPSPDAVAPLIAIASAYDRDPTIAERLARDFVDRSVDAAAAHAIIGALFDVLDDPPRARAEWQLAVAASPEVAFLRGLAESAARSGDGPAALVFATRAAAASGDPVVIWVGVAGALVDGHRFPDALTAARSALELAGPETLVQSLDVAIDASRAMGRTQQADALLAQRAQIATKLAAGDSERRTALTAHRDQPTASTLARLWVVSRSQPRDVEVRATLLAELDRDDPRRATIIEELLLLAGDVDARRAREAARALRSIDDSRGR